MFAQLSRWLAVFFFVFSVSGNASADKVIVSELVTAGYKIVGTSTAGTGGANKFRINVLYQKQDSLFICYIDKRNSSCLSVE